MPFIFPICCRRSWICWMDSYLCIQGWNCQWRKSKCIGIYILDCQYRRQIGSTLSPRKCGLKINIIAKISSHLHFCCFGFSMDGLFDNSCLCWSYFIRYCTICYVRSILFNSSIVWLWINYCKHCQLCHVSITWRGIFGYAYRLCDGLARL